ncbi:hypothetical protein BU15DRAFT_66268 [Melanogaster broomeanus]|nr:hypothetical protein BU15DRAFT_66268 [Melanogaster broomeanus]
MPAKEKTLDLGFYAVHCHPVGADPTHRLNYIRTSGMLTYTLQRLGALCVSAFIGGAFRCSRDAQILLRHDALFNRELDVSRIPRCHRFVNGPQGICNVPSARMILVILLGIYVPTISVLVVSAAIQDNTNLSVTTTEVAHSQSCITIFNTTPSIVVYTFVPRFILGILLFILAVTQFVRESLEMYKAIKQWRSNRYMELLVRESILYFIAYVPLSPCQAKMNSSTKSQYSPASNLLYNVACLVSVLGMPANLVLTMGAAVVPYVVAPRFVLSVRALHSCVVGNHIDTGFGAGSQRTNNSSVLFATHGMMPALEVETAGIGA